MRKKALIVIGTLLFCLSQIGVNYLIYKHKNNNVDIPRVQLRDVEDNKKVNKNTFAVMLEQTDGTYTQSNSSVWPGVGYLYNGELSGCIDNQGNAVENAISFNDSTKTATLRTNGTIYCYLYFKGVAPTSGSIKVNNNATYTTSTSVTLTLNAIDASEMCISNTTSCSSWESYSTSKNWTLTTGDGTKTVYVTYRNASGKIVGPVTDTIILDTTAPSLTVSAPASTSSSSPTVVTSASYTVKGTASDSTSGIKSVTVNGSAATISGSNWSKEITLTNGTTTKVTVLATDKAGKTTTITRYVKYEGTDANALVTKASLWNSGLEGDGYRYTGTNPNNYICFGTTNKSTCTGNTGAYMYRIIGVFEDSSGNKHMKLIKKEALNTAYAWNADYHTDIPWESSDLYKGLNDNYFLGNTTYMPDSTWSDRIKNWKWQIVKTLTDNTIGVDYEKNSGSNVYYHEIRKGIGASDCKNGQSNNVTCTIGEWATADAKIGLMYASDYLLSLGTTALTLTSEAYYPFKTGWFILSNNDTESSDKIEWTIARSGPIENYGNNQFVWHIISTGRIENSSWHVAHPYSVRPTFYLNSDEVIASGSGTILDPFILK